MTAQSTDVPSFEQLVEAARRLSALLLDRGWTMASAESCTGGLIGAICTSLAGSSNWYERGFITYSNAAKTDSLGVPPESIEAHGAVSREVAEAMSVGALSHSVADIAVAVTGIAGPGGGTPNKPVGTVWIAAAVRRNGDSVEVESALLQLPGDRSAVRALTVARALSMLTDRAGEIQSAARS